MGRNLLSECKAKRRLECEVFLFFHHHHNINFCRLVRAILTSCVDEKMSAGSRLRPGSVLVYYTYFNGPGQLSESWPCYVWPGPGPPYT
ncbi:hypothetical protein PoB_006442200 [Plakobranchus ocellatus]|uniref:Uncharacterized protein n=1 Tax=Plakobranchus ocellatus TaxID=259542 RepID=A0AAV4D188_9GAST|nr:hypothetical protein PoB_006442200 [Plakobranchus ocellatus]